MLVKRFDSQRITSKQQRFSLSIHERESKHAFKSWKERRSISYQSIQHDLGVAGASELNSRIEKLAP